MISRLKYALLPMVAAALCAPQPVEAEVRLNRTDGVDATVPVLTWWDIPFRSVVRQRYDFSCGSAAIATLLTYHYDRPTPEIVAFKKMWKTGNRDAIKKVGFSMFDMKAYLESIGYTAAGFRLNMKELLQVKRPVIVLLDMKGFKHFVVVKGMTDDKILLGDSVLGITKYSHKDFEEMWNGIVLAIVKGPGGKRMKGEYNLAGDWGPWSKAPLEESGDAISVAVGDLTTYLNPDYQVTPQILLDVRVGTVR